MLKFILIAAIAGTVLNLGTYFTFDETTVTVNETEFGNCLAVSCPGDVSEPVNKHGFPFEFFNQAVKGDASQLPDRVRSLQLSGLFANIAFWSVIAATLYVVFDKVRDTVGNIILIGVGMLAALVYFGVIIIQ